MEHLKRILFLFIALTAVFVFIVEEGVHITSIWNISPLMIAALLTSLLKGLNGRARSASIGYIACSIMSVGFFHLAWLYDWGRIASGSSTASMMFMVLPILTVLIGIMGSIVGMIFL
jgi:hypothetical protein